MNSTIRFGTSGWRSIVADEFTVANIRLAVAGIAAVVLLLAYEHRLVKAGDLSRVDAAFFMINGYVSVLLFLFWAGDILFLERGI